MPRQWPRNSLAHPQPDNGVVVAHLRCVSVFSNKLSIARSISVMDTSLLDIDVPAGLEPSPSIFRWTIGFLLVGMAWGFTTPFMRRMILFPLSRFNDTDMQNPGAALNHVPPIHASLSDPSKSRFTKFILKLFWAVIDLLRRPAYAVPFLLNVTGSVWFFLLIGQAGESSLSEEA